VSREGQPRRPADARLEPVRPEGTTPPFDLEYDLDWACQCPAMSWCRLLSYYRGDMEQTACDWSMYWRRKRRGSGRR